MLCAGYVNTRPRVAGRANRRDRDVLRRIVGLAVVIAIATTGVALADGVATYHGTTNQKLPISVGLKGFKVVKLSFTAKYGSCGTLSTSGGVSLQIKGSGFTGTVKPTPSSKVTITGTFGNGKTLHGSLHAVVSKGATTCSSGRITYRAALT
jgi:hypothetical protein